MRFWCPLDGQPDHLVPRHFLRAKEDAISKKQLVFNPDCWIFRDVGKVMPYENVVLAKTPQTNTIWPYFCEADFYRLLLRLQSGEVSLEDTTPEIRVSLQLASILITPHVSPPLEDQASKVFQQRGFVPLRSWIPALQVSALRRYYRHALRTGQFKLGDVYCPRRYYVHNEEIAVYFHHQLTNAVAAVVGEAVKPSYVYVACYLEGEKLDEHVDREQCEYTVSVSLDYSPDPRLATPWPIHLRTSSGMITVFQALGDGLLFRGREIPHFRLPLPKGHSSTSIFFHYVKQEFAGSLE